MPPREPRRVAAGAGLAPRPRLASAFFTAAIAITPSYLPSTDDPRLFMIDLSQYNNVDMYEIANYPLVSCQAVNIRIGGSASVKDTKFLRYWTAAKVEKIPRSIYMYTWPGWTVSQHVSNFMQSVEQWTPGDLGEGPIWVDVETTAGKSRREVSNHAIAVIEALQSETGKEIGWYTGKWFIDGYMEIQDWMADLWAWLAAYWGNNTQEHPGPVPRPSIIPESKVAIHQTGSRCRGSAFGGSGTFDTDRWESTQAAFRQLYRLPPIEPPNGDLAEQVSANRHAIVQLRADVDHLTDLAGEVRHTKE